jgi:hypothetical protein
MEALRGGGRLALGNPGEKTRPEGNGGALRGVVLLRRGPGILRLHRDGIDRLISLVAQSRRRVGAEGGVHLNVPTTIVELDPSDIACTLMALNWTQLKGVWARWNVRFIELHDVHEHSLRGE